MTAPRWGKRARRSLCWVVLNRCCILAFGSWATPRGAPGFACATTASAHVRRCSGGGRPPVTRSLPCRCEMGLTTKSLPQLDGSWEGLAQKVSALCEAGTASDAFKIEEVLHPVPRGSPACEGGEEQWGCPGGFFPEATGVNPVPTSWNGVNPWYGVHRAGVLTLLLRVEVF